MPRSNRCLFPMRSSRSVVRCFPAFFPTLTLVFIGIVAGFAITMCIQSLHYLPTPSAGPRARNHCAASASQRRILKTNEDDHGRSFDLDPSSSQNLILVGIMTAQKYVDTRAWNVWRTWGQTLPGRVFFFVAEHTETAHPELPLIRLPGVDDSYPPQKKSFMMFRWMADHGLNQFEWFLRADDDVYVRGDRLEIFLRSLNSSKPLFLGQAGLGTPEEYGTLSLGSEDNYCMGGPGIILSRTALAMVRPHIGECLRNMYTTHEDVEVGRCIRKFAGVSCSWSYEVRF